MCYPSCQYPSSPNLICVNTVWAPTTPQPSSHPCGQIKAPAVWSQAWGSLTTLITLPCLYTTLHTLPGKQRHRLQGQACSNLNCQQPVQGTSQQVPPCQHPVSGQQSSGPRSLSISTTKLVPKTQEKQSREWDVDWSKYSPGTQISDTGGRSGFNVSQAIHSSARVYATCIWIGDSLYPIKKKLPHFLGGKVALEDTWLFKHWVLQNHSLTSMIYSMT